MVLHFDVAFAVEVVLDITKSWRNVWLNPKVSPFLCLLGLSVLILSPRMMKKPAESLDDQRSVLDQMVS